MHSFYENKDLLTFELKVQNKRLFFIPFVFNEIISRY